MFAQRRLLLPISDIGGLQRCVQRPDSPRAALGTRMYSTTAHVCRLLGPMLYSKMSRLQPLTKPNL